MNYQLPHSRSLFPQFPNLLRKQKKYCTFHRLLNETFCHFLPKKLNFSANQISCITSVVLYSLHSIQYHLGPWSACNVLCGPGERTRSVTCHKRTENGTLEVLDEGECQDEEKPEAEEECQVSSIDYCPLRTPFPYESVTRCGQFSSHLSQRDHHSNAC